MISRCLESQKHSNKNKKLQNKQEREWKNAFISCFYLFFLVKANSFRKKLLLGL